MDRTRKIVITLIIGFIISSLAFTTLYYGVNLKTEVPELPVDQLPLMQGRASSDILYVEFANSIKDFDNSRVDICFLINNDNIVKIRTNKCKLHSIGQVKTDNTKKHILQQIENGNFITSRGNYPMSSLGRINIIDIEFVYFSLFDDYPYEYEGEITYYPSWKITAETSNYGNVVLMIKAFS